jgi:hypothetical protein
MPIEEAIRIYARAMRAWFRAAAPAKAEEKIARLAEAGDQDGVSVWQGVLDHIRRLDQDGTPYRSLA